MWVTIRLLVWVTARLLVWVTARLLAWVTVRLLVWHRLLRNKKTLFQKILNLKDHKWQEVRIGEAIKEWWLLRRITRKTAIIIL